MIIFEILYSLLLQLFLQFLLDSIQKDSDTQKASIKGQKLFVIDICSVRRRKRRERNKIFWTMGMIMKKLNLFAGIAVAISGLFASQTFAASGCISAACDPAAAAAAAFYQKGLSEMVGDTGFEPVTPCL